MRNRKRTTAAGVMVAMAVAAIAAAAFGYVSSAGAASQAMARCKVPKKTVVTVKEYEYGFTLIPKTPHCGTVTFKQKNTGSTTHNFDITGVKSGKLIPSGQSTSFTIKIGPGKFQYICDVIGHAQLGMVGNMKVVD
jgi:plastocyanin